MRTKTRELCNLILFRFGEAAVDSTLRRGPLGLVRE